MDDTVYLSGRVNNDDKNRTVSQGDMEDQMRQAYSNIRKLLLRIAAKTHTSIVDKGSGEIKAGEILSPIDISTNLALGNNLLAIGEYNSAIEIYDIIIKNSQDDELLSMALKLGNQRLKDHYPRMNYDHGELQR